MEFCKNVFAFFGIISIAGAAVSTQNNPNILFFLTDDWGFNDVGYYENSGTQTPYIDNLVSTEAIRIDKFYVLPECTITRCALLTGRHPMRYGMQDGILQFQSAYALSRHETLISNEFQNQGYKTWLVGKWHVGMRNWDYTPTYRGFDHFVGYYGGLINYYDHYGQNKVYKSTVDFRWDEKEYEEENTYTLNTYNERILSLLDEFTIQEKEAKDANVENKPFFMYVGWQGSHSPSEAPDDYADMYTSSARVDSNYRQYFQAQTTMTDDLFAMVVKKLKTTGLWENTLVIVASDNGGSVDYGDNAPLRGAKFTIWEGGIRVPAFITGGKLPNNLRGTVLDQFPLHVTDWYATLLNAAGLEVTSPNELDGKNMWPMILNSNNIKSNENDGSLSIVKETNEVTNTMLSQLNNDRYILVNVNSAGCVNELCGALIYGGRWKIMMTNNQINQNLMTNTAFWLRTFASGTDDVLGCNEIPDDVVTQGDPGCNTTVCLFDLMSDPCEYYDVSKDYPEITNKLYSKLKEYYDSQTPPLNDLLDYVDYDDIDPTDTGFWHPYDNSPWYEVEFEIFLNDYYNNDDNNNIEEGAKLEILANAPNAANVLGETTNENPLFGLSDGQFFGLIVAAFLMLGVCFAYVVSNRRSPKANGYESLTNNNNNNNNNRSVEEIAMTQTNYNSFA